MTGFRAELSRAILAVAAGAGVAVAAPADPTAVELLQSQGCSSCPPADAILNSLDDRADLPPLNFGVTYRDQLGWKAGFADPAYTAQRRYGPSRAGNLERTGGNLRPPRVQERR